MSTEHYTQGFFAHLRIGATRSAEIIAPLVVNLLPVRSVVDIGCGDGSWLAVFRELGVDDIHGVDGEYVDRALLQIPHDCFQALDLAQPLRLERVFDLAISLEVAEHLPQDCAPGFVEGLTRLAPFVLFSAAIPFQGGDNHINEQWPDAWAALFKRHDYVPVDFIRKRVWQDNSVEWWYAQNTLLFARADLIESNTALKAEFEQTNPDQLCLVHPRRYLGEEGVAHGPRLRQPSGVKEASRLLLVALKNSLRKRLYSIFDKTGAALISVLITTHSHGRSTQQAIDIFLSQDFPL
jgi:SAM-dependent methyltransferase